MKYRFGFYIKHKLLQCVMQTTLIAIPELATAHTIHMKSASFRIYVCAQYLEIDIILYRLNNLQVADFRHFSLCMEFERQNKPNESDRIEGG